MSNYDRYYSEYYPQVSTKPTVSIKSAIAKPIVEPTEVKPVAKHVVTKPTTKKDKWLDISVVGAAGVAIIYLLTKNVTATTTQPPGTTTIQPPGTTTTQPPSTGGTLLNAAEINAQKAKTGSNPWASAYTNLISRAETAYNGGNYSVTYDSYIPPSCDKHDYYSCLNDCTTAGYNGCATGGQTRVDYNAILSFGTAVRNLALGYAFSGQTRYADKAIQLINTWCVNSATKMTPRFYYAGQSYQVYIEVPIGLIGAFYGASVLLDLNYSGWNSSDKTAFKQWVTDILTSHGTDFAYDYGATCAGYDGITNFTNWQLAFHALGASITNNTTKLDWVFQRFRELIPIQMYTDGSFYFERCRYDYTGTIPCGLFYSVFCLEAMTEIAEVAKHKGVDLYGYKLADGRGLEKALDFHAPYIVNQTNWPYTKNQDPYIARMESITAQYELAYRWKQKQSYLNAINYWGRPIFDEDRNLGPTTLTHGV